MSTLEKLYARIAAGMGETEPTDFEVLAALNEEVGEYSLALRVEQGLKSKRLDEPSKNEAIDILLIAMECYIHSGGTYEELQGIANAKLKKWEASFS